MSRRVVGVIVKFATDCDRCGNTIRKGDQAIPVGRFGRYIHVGCASGANDG